jgi:hypothetical protein
MSTSPVTQDVFTLVLARRVAASSGAAPGLVHLTWRAPEQGERLVMVFADGVHMATSDSPEQCEMWLRCPSHQAVVIELVAVDPAAVSALPWRNGLTAARAAAVDADAEALPVFRRGLNLALFRDERWPIDTRIRVSVDGQAVHEALLWPMAVHRGGLGALFGVGAFGFDHVTGPGLGAGALGQGPLGADNSLWCWNDVDASPGEHTLSLTAVDGQGHAVALASDPVTQTVDALPAPAASFTITPDFTLQWSR